MSLLEHLLGRRDKTLLHMSKGISYRTTPIQLDISLYDKLIECQHNFIEIMRYIYDHHASQLLDYHNIKDIRISHFIKQLIVEKKPQFEDHNFISRGDYFFTKQGFQVAEVNQDTPGGRIEAMYLSKLPDSLVNQTFMQKFADYYTKKGYKNIFLVTGIGDRGDRKMIEMLCEVLKHSGIESYVGLFEWLDRDDDGYIYKGQRIDAIHKDLPIDWIYKQYSQESISTLEDFVLSGKVALMNHPIGYIFQLKTYYAYLREHLTDFPADIQTKIKLHIPETHRLSDQGFPIEDIKKHKNKYVLKNINNRLSQDVYLGVDVKQKDWDDLLQAYQNNSYRIAQKYFDVILLGNLYINFGMYSIGMQPADMYLRVNNKKAKLSLEYTAPYQIDRSKNLWNRMIRWLFD